MDVLEHLLTVLQLSLASFWFRQPEMVLLHPIIQVKEYG
jgi:hypothetical protein